jgi:predicted MFS family arabinose efflux permease
LLGLVIFSVTIAPFGFASTLWVLDALRFIQGIGCGLVWAGGLAWAIAIAPRGRRNQTIGTVFGAAIVGTVIGPVLGTLAVAIGTGVVFTIVGATSVALILLMLQHPEPRSAIRGSVAPITVVIGSVPVCLAFGLMLLEAVTLGAIYTLLPLRLSRLGASGLLIGSTFVVASLLGTFVTVAIGRVVDQTGFRAPLSVGLGLSCVLVALLPLPKSALLLATLTALTLGGPLMASVVPVMSLMTGAVEGVGATLAFASMLLNVASALGEMIGAPVAAGLARATSDTVPLLLLAAAMLLMLAVVLRARALHDDAQSVAPASVGPVSFETKAS